MTRFRTRKKSGEKSEKKLFFSGTASKPTGRASSKKKKKKPREGGGRTSVCNMGMREVKIFVRAGWFTGEGGEAENGSEKRGETSRPRIVQVAKKKRDKINPL